MNRLLILDGNSVLHRAYYALPDWRNRSGEATAGVYGFLSMTLKAIEELRPSHLVVVFDHPSPTFRHSIYVGYQTNREKDRRISEDIWGQVKKLQTVFEKMRVPVYQIGGFEADDIIGTLCQKIKNQKTKSKIVVITGDRDLMQLVDDNVSLYMPVKGVTDAVMIGPDKVREKMGVDPNQIIDYKGLVGDASDNYPGVEGIGPKTARNLLNQYGTLEDVYNNLDKINPVTAGKLAGGHQAAVLSKSLATIKTDVPFSIEWGKAAIPDQDQILSVLKELGYKSLIKRVGGLTGDDTQPGLFD